MVMIPVGNSTHHKFSVWCFPEAYIRILISAVVFTHMPGASIIPLFTLWILGILFFMWSARPIYYQIRCLYNSYVWGKNKAESDKLLEDDVLDMNSTEEDLE